MTDCTYTIFRSSNQAKEGQKINNSGLELNVAMNIAYEILAQLGK